ncbi:hypothetical protein HN51_004760, partial [Arachis hypogaea]
TMRERRAETRDRRWERQAGKDSNSKERSGSDADVSSVRDSSEVTEVNEEG